MNTGLIQVYTGKGKGKTTAAFGLAVRAWGRNWRIIIFQMLKSGTGSGEQNALASLKPSIPIVALGTGDLIIDRPPTATEIEGVKEGWNQVVKAIFSREYDLIIIDELSHVINLNLLDLGSVLEVLRNKPGELELVLTGRDMPESIMNEADLVTEMRQVKHPYQKGIKARQGIEY